MYCPQCGKQNEEGAVHCTQCGALINSAAAVMPPPIPQQFAPPPQYIPPSQYPGVPPPMSPLQIPNYMVQAVLVTLFCCLPLGIVAIMKANTINKKIAAGDIAGAMADSTANKKLLWWGCIVGGVITALYVIGTMAKMKS